MSIMQKNSLRRQFLEYWIGGRFKNLDEHFVSRFWDMAENNGFRIRTYEVEE